MMLLLAYFNGQFRLNISRHNCYQEDTGSRIFGSQGLQNTHSFIVNPFATEKKNLFRSLQEGNALIGKPVMEVIQEVDWHRKFGSSFQIQSNPT